jgi:hypothetical protein
MSKAENSIERFGIRYLVHVVECSGKYVETQRNDFLVMLLLILNGSNQECRV